MKLFVVFAVLFVSALTSPAPNPYYVEPGFANADTYDEFLEQIKATASRATEDQKIASGTAAKKGEFNDFCYLSISFFQKSQTCGCYIHAAQYVVTSARCVKDCSEGMAANITVNIASASGKDAVRSIEKFWVPDGTNGMAFLAIYDVTDGTGPDFRVIKENNVAVIKLAKALTVDTKGPVSIALMTQEADVAAWQMSHKAADGWKLRACGIGVTDNYGTRAKGVTCTDVNIEFDAAKCLQIPTDTTAVTVPPGQMCVRWADRDNNVCVADFGGPIYAYQTDKDGKFAKQEVVCIVVGSPTVRSNAQCLDGHVTLCQWLPAPAAMMNAQSWIVNMVATDGVPAAGR